MVSHTPIKNAANFRFAAGSAAYPALSRTLQRYLIVSGAIAGAALCAMSPDATHAQSAEQHSRVMNDIAATPPQQNGSDSDDHHSVAAQPGRPTMASFMAAAYHAGTGSVWLSVAHATLDSAKERVLNACNTAAGGGCSIAASIGGLGQVSVSQDAMGLLWVKGAVGDELFETPDVSMRDCLTYSFGCDLLDIYGSEPIYLDEDPDRDQSKDYFPRGQLKQGLWAMVARPADPSVAAHSKSWLISGKENSGATLKEILEPCEAESGVQCAVSAFARAGDKATDNGWIKTNSVLVHYVDAQGKNYWTSALPAGLKRKKKKSPLGGYLPVYPDPVTVQERVNRLCLPAQKCKVVGTYDAATPRLQVIADMP